MLVNVLFWRWWFRWAGTWWLFWPQTVAFGYIMAALPTGYWYFVGWAQRPVHQEPEPTLRVAMVTLCVPSHESLDVITRQLERLTAVTYPHDSWILDEGGSHEVQALAQARGVRYFTRKDIPGYNQPGPPYQAKTKAGNVNAWLEDIRRRGISYDVFVQLDIDHRPRPDYLDRTLGYFRDDEVGWVQAPSVVGNLDDWAARGLAEQDLPLQGPLQMGFYGNSRTPFIIGSHTTYRTDAIHRIGGFQPTRAEDHLDTVVLAAHGYCGVFVPELIAVGDGPADLATYLRQQFAWAYSMVQIFINHTPRLIRHYSPRRAFQFLFAQSWYALWGMSLAILWVLPSVALLTGDSITEVHLSRFWLYFLPLPIVTTLMWRASHWLFQPPGLRLSWRGILLGIARWPVVLWATANVVGRVKRPYMITPKGLAGGSGTVIAHLPGIVLTGLPLAAVWVALFRSPHPNGYAILVIANAILGFLLLAGASVAEFRGLARQSGRLDALWSYTPLLVVVGLLGALLVSLLVNHWHQMTVALS